MTRNIYWIAALIILLALAAAAVIWREQQFTPTPPIQSPLPESPTMTKKLTYYCTGDKTIQATFKTAMLELMLSDNRSFTLPQVESGSGVRYEDRQTRYGTDVAFIGKGDNAFLLENDKTTYASCTAATIVESDAPGYATYTDVGRTFTFAFPTNFSVAGSAVGLSPGWSVFSNNASGATLATLVVPASVQRGTNFAGATFTIGASADPAAIAACSTAPAGTVATPAKLGELEVTQLTGSEHGAGQTYDSASYRLLHNAQCYAIEYTVHSSALANYPKGSVKAFDQKQITNDLDEVAKSFQFLK